MNQNAAISSLQIIKSLALITLFGLIVSVSNAASLYKWVDANGNVTYQDSPPPSNVEFEAREFESGEAEEAVENTAENTLAMEDAARENPVSLYTVPSCEVCDLVRLYLERNAIPFAEKNVQSSIPLQQELESRTGQLSVPTLLIGDLAIDGYSKSAIRAGLKSKGFPISDSQPETEPETGEVENASLPDVGIEEIEPATIEN